MGRVTYAAAVIDQHVGRGGCPCLITEQLSTPREHFSEEVPVHHPRSTSSTRSTSSRHSTQTTGSSGAGSHSPCCFIPAALTLLSVTSVNVALSAIREGLGASTVAQSLVLTLYALFFALVRTLPLTIINFVTSRDSFSGGYTIG